jgi:hypothetical protein
MTRRMKANIFWLGFTAAFCLGTSYANGGPTWGSVWFGGLMGGFAALILVDYVESRP